MLCLWEESAQNHQRSDTEESKDPELPAGYQAPLLAPCPKEIRRHKAKQRSAPAFAQRIGFIFNFWTNRRPSAGLWPGPTPAVLKKAPLISHRGGKRERTFPQGNTQMLWHSPSKDSPCFSNPALSKTSTSDALIAAGRTALVRPATLPGLGELSVSTPASRRGGEENIPPLECSQGTSSHALNDDLLLQHLWHPSGAPTGTPTRTAIYNWE